MSDDKIVPFPERKPKSPKKPAVSEKPGPHRVKIKVCQSSLNALKDIEDRVKAGRLVGFTGLLWDPHEKTFSMWTNFPSDMSAEQAATLYIGGLSLIEEMLRRIATDAWIELRDNEDDPE